MVPHAERRPIIACTFSSVKYPGRAPEGHVLLRVFLGGALNEAVLEGDDATLVQTARERARRAARRSPPSPLFARVARHARRDAAVPRGPHGPRGGDRAGGGAASRACALAGGAYRGVGIADCVRSGEDAAETLLEDAERERAGR